MNSTQRSWRGCRPDADRDKSGTEPSPGASNEARRITSRTRANVPDGSLFNVLNLRILTGKATGGKGEVGSLFFCV